MNEGKRKYDNAQRIVAKLSKLARQGKTTKAQDLELARQRLIMKKLEG